MKGDQPIARWTMGYYLQISTVRQDHHFKVSSGNSEFTHYNEERFKWRKFNTEIALGSLKLNIKWLKTLKLKNI